MEKGQDTIVNNVIFQKICLMAGKSIKINNVHVHQR